MVQKLKSRSCGRVVGLTGIFGSGKSTVAREFQKLGARCVDADRLAHEPLRKGCDLFEKIRRLFPEALGEGGRSLDRRKLAAVIFSNAKRRRQLEKLLHPYVYRRFLEIKGKSKAKVLIFEVPLLFEAGFDRVCDKTLVVKAGRGVILRRLREKGFSEKEIERRLGAQMKLAEKISRADLVMDNSGSRNETRKRVKDLWKKINA